MSFCMVCACVADVENMHAEFEDPADVQSVLQTKPAIHTDALPDGQTL